MFAVGVSNYIMVAHSLRGATFGPAQRLHGATYEVRVEIESERLDADGIVVDIGRLGEALASALAPLNYQNLDALPAFAGRNSTTEVLCAYIHEQLVGELGPRPEAALSVTLVESPVAWARYSGPLAPRANGAR